MRWVMVAVIVGMFAASAGAAMPERPGILGLCERAGTLRDAGLGAHAQGPPYEMMDRRTPAEDVAELIGGDSGLKSALEKASESSAQLTIVAGLLTLLYTLRPAVRELVMALDPPVAAAATASSEPPAPSPEDTAEPDAGIG